MDEDLVAEARGHVDALEELMRRMEYSTLHDKKLALAEQYQPMFSGLRAELSRWAARPESTLTQD